MNNAIETIKYKGIDIETFYDSDAESPDYWGNNEFFLVYDHRQFNVKRNGFDPYDIHVCLQEGKKLYNGYYAFPVYAYIHSGVALSLSRDSYPFTDRWDVSTTGFMLVKRQKGTYTENKAFEIAEACIKSWNIYLSGEVYGYSSTAGNCCGFYGKDGYKEMIEQAKEEIDFDINIKNQEAIKKHTADVKKWIKNRVPFEYREDLHLPYPEEVL